MGVQLNDEGIERALLGACIQSKEALWAALSAGVTEEYFYREEHRLVWSALSDIGQNGSGEADEPQVIHWLRNQDLLTRVGGAAFVAGLTDEMPAPHLAGEYAEILRRLYLGRDIDQICRVITTIQDPVERIDAFNGAYLRIAGGMGWKGTRKLSRILEDTKEVGSGHLARSGIPFLDSKVNFRRGTLNIIAAAPGIGKTSLSIQYALHEASMNGHVLFASAEMTGEELFERAVAITSRLSSSDMHQVSEQVWEVMKKAREKILEYDTIQVMDPGAVTPARIMGQARMMKGRDGLHLVVVDYLQLLTLDGSKNMRREEVVSELARQCKIMAQELHVPVILCSQLSRSHLHEKRAPQLYDLRESGAIEAHADTVTMLWRRDPDDRLVFGLVRKQRHGETGVAQLSFNPGARFDDYGAIDLEVLP